MVWRNDNIALVEDLEMGYCTWAGMNEANRIYHDTEWGIPVHDDRHMFEHLTLECLQCGLSWDLMLKKREREPRVSCLNPRKTSRDLLQHVSRPDSPTMAREQ